MLAWRTGRVKTKENGAERGEREWKKESEIGKMADSSGSSLAACSVSAAALCSAQHSLDSLTFFAPGGWDVMCMIVSVECRGWKLSQVSNTSTTASLFEMLVKKKLPQRRLRLLLLLLWFRSILLGCLLAPVGGREKAENSYLHIKAQISSCVTWIDLSSPVCFARYVSSCCELFSSDIRLNYFLCLLLDNWNLVFRLVIVCITGSLSETVRVIQPKQMPGGHLCHPCYS